MHLPTLNRKREVQARLDLPDHPREIAVEWIRTLIDTGRAGLDPFDRAVFILVAYRNEVTWAYRTLELTGKTLTVTHTERGGRRYGAILEADVRMRLGLDAADAPVMADEPLASRAVTDDAEQIVEVH